MSTNTRFKPFFCDFHTKHRKVAQVTQHGKQINLISILSHLLFTHVVNATWLAFFVETTLQKAIFQMSTNYPPEKKSVMVRVVFLFLFAIKVLQDIWWDVCYDVCTACIVF